MRYSLTRIFTTRYAGRLLKRLRFESCVNPKVTQTGSLVVRQRSAFESCVNPKVTQTAQYVVGQCCPFESCVNPKVTQTNPT